MQSSFLSTERRSSERSEGAANGSSRLHFQSRLEPSFSAVPSGRKLSGESDPAYFEIADLY